MIVEAIDIAAVRGTRTVLSEVSLTVRPGEVFGLLGPNGAGKTSLLRLLAGLDAPAAGTITYNGSTANALGRAVLGRALAYFAQGGRIHWPLRVEEVVALGRLPHRSGPAADARAIAAAMAAADVEHLRGRTAGSLSGGERMRVLLARALAVEGSVLLADEPIAGLDPAHQLHAMEVLRSTARQGAAVVVVVHDLTLAARFCDRLALLANGHVHALGTPAEVLTPANISAVFGVCVETGTRDGEPFILPWRRVSQET